MYEMGCTLSPPGDYEGRIDATVTAATCSHLQPARSGQASEIPDYSDNVSVTQRHCNTNNGVFDLPNPNKDSRIQF